MARLISLTLLSVQFMLLVSLVAGDAVHDLWAKGLSALDTQLDKSPTCTRANLRVRKDWYVQPLQTEVKKGPWRD